MVYPQTIHEITSGFASLSGVCEDVTAAAAHLMRSLSVPVVIRRNPWRSDEVQVRHEHGSLWTSLRRPGRAIVERLREDPGGEIYADTTPLMAASWGVISDEYARELVRRGMEHLPEYEARPCELCLDPITIWESAWHRDGQPAIHRRCLS